MQTRYYVTVRESHVYAVKADSPDEAVERALEIRGMAYVLDPEKYIADATTEGIAVRRLTIDEEPFGPFYGGNG